MAIIQSGVDATQLTIDPTLKTARVVLKPDELTGAYQYSGASAATTGLSATNPVFSFRYSPGTSAVCVVKRVSIGFVTTAFTTAGQHSFGLFAARSFSGSDSGGSGTTLSGNNNKYRTSLATTGVADIRISTSGTLTAGTRTLDTNPLGLANFYVSAVGTSLAPTELINYDINDYPLVLANNEGFVITSVLAFPVSNAGTIVVNVEWFETSAY
jgi:hypothetical protein